MPEILRSRTLELAHEGHPGIVQMKKRLRSKVWWPGIYKDCERQCRTCHGCQSVGMPLKPEPMARTKLPELRPSVPDDESIRDEDRLKKFKGKEYADDRRRAAEADICIDDKVPMKQRTTTSSRHHSRQSHTQSKVKRVIVQL